MTNPPDSGRELPRYSSARAQMSEFLRSEGKPDNIVWVFKDDLFLSDRETAFVRYPVPPDTETLAEKVYDEGQRKGLVELSAIAATGNETFVSIWYPRSEDEEIDGWAEGVKMTIADPLAAAVLVKNAAEWWFWRKLPPYRRYQKDALWIGDREWARA